MIEISATEYWKEMDYYSGILYCSLLEIGGKNDWRMFKNWDEYESMTRMVEIRRRMVLWVEKDKKRSSEAFLVGKNYMVIPVRDV
jgi:hypothetical protein